MIRAKLFQHGYDVSLIDGWNHKSSIQQEGLHIDINVQCFDIPMYRFSQIPQSEVYDIVFLFPKSMQLKHVLEDIQPHLHIKQSLYVQ